MNNIDEFSQIKQKVEKLREKKTRAEGALEQSVQRMQDEMEVDTIEEGREVLEKLEQSTNVGIQRRMPDCIWIIDFAGVMERLLGAELLEKL
jgi:predicted transcriptional regulator